jgi:hypothetical protein
MGQRENILKIVDDIRRGENASALKGLKSVMQDKLHDRVEAAKAKDVVFNSANTKDDK